MELRGVNLSLEMQACDIVARLAAGLSAPGDRHSLLMQLIEPTVVLSQARAGTAYVREPGSDGMRQIGGFEAHREATQGERTVVIALTHRGDVLGEYRLVMPPTALIGETTARFHRTLGALLGLALHDARVDKESRREILAEVHDGLAQTLVFARMRLPLLEQAVAAKDGDSALRLCAQLRQAMGQAQTNLRAILNQLSAPMDPRGLRHALGASVQAFRKDNAIALGFDDRAPLPRLSASQESEVFLVVQEALANVAKHSGAAHAWMRIEEHDGTVQVVIEDDGAGPPADHGQDSASHFGLPIMRQRAARLGGTLEMGQRMGGGLRIGLRFAAQPAKAEAA